MKKILTVCAALSLIAALAFTTQTENKKDLARVNRVQGYYIFIQCAPLTEYDVLGTVKKTGVTWTDDPEEKYNTLIKRTKKDFPKCDGIIFDDIQLEHATCIQLK